MTIPEYGICHLSEEVIKQADPDIEIDNANSGLAFYSKYLPDAVPVNDSFLEKMINRETERVLLFDILVNDYDRHKGNVLCSFSQRKIIFIDCSHIMAAEDFSLNTDFDMKKELSRDQLSNISILANHSENIYNRLCLKVGFNEDILYEESKKIKGIITKDVLTSIFRSIPEDWLSFARYRLRAENMKTIIETKLSMIDTITDIIAEERRSGGWKKY